MVQVDVKNVEFVVMCVRLSDIWFKEYNFFKFIILKIYNVYDIIIFGRKVGFMELRIIARIRTDFKEKFGIPRQSGIAESTLGKIVFEKEYRRQYVGDLVMRALADKAERLGAKWMIVKAPVHLKGFFEFESYEVCGDEFIKNGEPHILMKKDLTKKQPCRGCSQ